MATSPDMNLDGLERRFEPTFSGSRQERRWIRDSLGDLFEDGWFDDVLYRVQGGKEATVYCCRAHPTTGLDLLAAKVFRPRVFRAMRNDAHYKLGRGLMDGEGKRVLDARSLRALRGRTRYGKKLDSMSWVHHEHAALLELHEAGADVPRPLAVAENALLMEFVGDVDGAASILHGVRLGSAEARTVLDRLIENVRIALGLCRVHADLSAYNVLYHQGEIRIIDWPQCVDALRHPDGFGLLCRDLDRLGSYFARQGLVVDATGLAFELWSERFGP